MSYTLMSIKKINQGIKWMMRTCNIQIPDSRCKGLISKYDGHQGSETDFLSQPYQWTSLGLLDGIFNILNAKNIRKWLLTAVPSERKRMIHEWVFLQPCMCELPSASKGQVHCSSFLSATQTGHRLPLPWKNSESDKLSVPRRDNIWASEVGQPLGCRQFLPESGVREHRSLWKFFW